VKNLICLHKHEYQSYKLQENYAHFHQAVKDSNFFPFYSLVNEFKILFHFFMHASAVVYNALEVNKTAIISSPKLSSFTHVQH